VIRDNDPTIASVEDDIVRDLAKIGINVNTRVVNASAYIKAETEGDYHMLFTRTWGAPYDPHSYFNGFAVPAHVEYSAIGGLEPPLTRDALLEMIADVQVQSDPLVVADKWEEILQEMHNQAMFIPLWGTRIPYVLNRRFAGFTPSTQTYSYPLSSVKIHSGSGNVTVAPGAGGSLFSSIGPVHAHQYYPNQLFVQSWIYEGLVGCSQETAETQPRCLAASHRLPPPPPTPPLAGTGKMGRSRPSSPPLGLCRRCLLEELNTPLLFGRASSSTMDLTGTAPLPS